jgi:hypothetical protein
MRFVQGVGQEIFADTVTAGISGLLTRRVEFGSGVTYSSGRDQPNGRHGYGTYSASARIGYALSRNVSLFTQYFYLHYRFNDSVVLPAGTPHDLGRQGVRVGLALWAPLTR